MQVAASFWCESEILSEVGHYLTDRGATIADNPVTRRGGPASCPAGGEQMATTVKIELVARELRFLRAAQEVLKRYRITRPESPMADGALLFEVAGGQEPYYVRVHPQWAHPPTCTCPDASRLALLRNGGYCKHIIAILLREQELRGQLLELLL